MPAILRNSLPNLLPSICNIGSYAFAGAIAGGVGVRRVRSPPCPMVGSRHWSANIMPCPTDRPSGPPPIVSTRLSILSNSYGSFGLVAAAGNDW